MTLLFRQRGLYASFILITCLMFTACSKTERMLPDDSKATKERFFAVSLSANPEIRKLADHIRRQDSVSNFLPAFVRKNGMPNWEKVVYRPVTRNSTGLATAGKGVFLVPLQHPTSGEVTAYIAAVKHNEGAYTLRVYNKKDLAGIHPAGEQEIKALRSTQALFGYFEKEINHKASLALQDGTVKNVSLHWGTPPVSALVRAQEDYCIITESLYVVYEWRDFTWGDGAWVPIAAVYEITIECYSGGGSGGGGDTGGGWGEPGGGGDGGEPGGNWWDSGSGYPGGNNGPGSPQDPYDSWDPWWTSGGGGGGGFSYDEAWFNSLPPYTIDLSGLNDYPCAQGIANAVIGLNNSTTKIINELFGESAKFNLNFTVDPALSVAGNTSAAPAYQKINGSYQNLVYLNITIKLNPSHLTGANKIAIAQTIIHEMIHAYFYYRSAEANGDPAKEQALAQELGFLKPYDPNAAAGTFGNQHEQMASSYVEKMAAALKDYKLITEADLAPLRGLYQDITVDQYYTAMAWAGLTGSVNGYVTKAWEDFETNNPALAQRYKVIIAAEENATELAATKEKC